MGEAGKSRAARLPGACLALALLAAPAAAQDAAPAPAAEVALVRQDSSDCADSDVSAKDPSRIGGTAWVLRQSDGKTSVKVAITATPNTAYHFFLKCVTALGDVTTGDEGVGVADFTFPTSSAGAVFAFDMYPQGAPAGDKFQSVQVRLSP